MYPENPAGQTFISQDTYASAGASLSGLGGGGGTVGPVINGLQTINADPTVNFLINQEGDNEVSLQNNNGNNDITIKADGSIQFNYNNDYGVIIDPTGRSIEIYPGSSNPEGALEGISTINGVGVGAFTGSIPANLNVSTLAVIGTGNITLDADPSAGESAFLLFNTPGQDTEAAGQLAINKIPNILSLGPVSTVSGLLVNSFSTVFGQVQPIMSKSIILGGDNNDATKPGAEIGYTNTTSTLSMYAPNVNISSLVGVSSINGAPYSTGGGVPANLTVSTLTVLSTLSVIGSGLLTLNTNLNNPVISGRLLFNTAGQDTEDAGQLGLLKYTGLASLGPVTSQSGLLVNAFSTVTGQLQPIMSKSIILGGDNNDSGTPGAEIGYTNTTSTLSMYAPNVAVTGSLTTSKILGLTSINSEAYFAPRSGIFFLPTGGTTGYYAIPNPPDGITTNAVVLCTLTRPDGTSQNWIVNSGVVQGATPANWYIEVVMASVIVDDNTAVAWTLVAADCTPGVAGTAPT
jgi:hypothetical protein